ncbi:hypothetical protein G6O67_006477 [Ophiocordyceps sinensis]|uniref:CRIB domain-containing protein n=2 Tax=Ophiocordyceps sinensis TaxID=72228 RepID=A0A8H4LWV8_9HYPO|nr:PAK domain-containing protein [Ophiocordyceps sinensis CO18]KAF4506387.1 hypothetical protein G6O67_006477 [Ophiocordyceps sinensis]
MALYSGALHRKSAKESPHASHPSATSLPCHQPPIPVLERLSSASVAQSVAPALDGPPSPKSVRPWKKQMKHMSRLHRQRGHRAASSESSSLTSMTGADRPPWEVAMDNLSLVRRSSTRSTESSTPSRHRPESTRTLGKILFHRSPKSKQKRRSRDSSGSSVYSADVTVDNCPPGPKEFLLPTIFSRRILQRDDAASKKVQISGPFNFQHVAHKRREDHAARVEPDGDTQDMSFRRAHDDPASLPAFRTSVEMGGSSFSSFPSHFMGGRHDNTNGALIPLPGLVPRHTGPGASIPRPAKLSLPQRWLQTSLPRSPTASPTSQSFPSVPLPFLPSRWSGRQKLPGPVACRGGERPQTSDGFAQPQVFDSVHPSAHQSHSTALCEKELPQVPEEEEELSGPLRRSRLSVVSTSSSLRGSHSVPTLRSMTGSQRRTSATSETLGHLYIAAVQCVVSVATGNKEGLEAAPSRERWEDDIDYCYDHEAEADCNYQWDRSSFEIARGFDTPPAPTAFMEEDLVEEKSRGSAQISPASQCFPALSPSSQASTETGHGAVTPTSNSIVTNVSSFRVEAKGFQRLGLENSRRGSGASFKEPQVVPLSPSLFIPSEFQQQLLLRETEFLQERSEAQGLKGPYHHFAYGEDAALHMSDQLVSCYQRSSLSTTTESTVGSDSTEKRHMSTASSGTTLTQHTASSASLSKMSGSTAPPFAPNMTARMPTDLELGSEGPIPRDVVPELTPLCLRAGPRKSGHKSHASASLVSDDVAPLKSPDFLKSRRQRARTASLSIKAPPPAGQYALFPRAYVKASGGQI